VAALTDALLVSGAGWLACTARRPNTGATQGSRGRRRAGEEASWGGGEPARAGPPGTGRSGVASSSTKFIKSILLLDGHVNYGPVRPIVSAATADVDVDLL
jgi:hypothetical protein